MYDNGLDIDEIAEKRLNDQVFKEFEKTLKRSDELDEYLSTLQQLVGDNAIIKFRKKNSKNKEWITWNQPQWRRSQAQSDNSHKQN